MVDESKQQNPNLESDEEIEFEFSIGSPAIYGGNPADEIFSNGRILPIYPVFNRDLLLEKSDPDPITLRSGSTSSTSSASDEVTDGPHCLWAPPSPVACKKSSSTGSDNSKRFRVRDLIGGRRSHSDGKEKFVFLSSDSGTDLKTGPGPDLKTGPGTGKGNPKPKKEMDLVTAHRLFYGKEKEKEKGNGKRSFLPYRPELVGLFAGSRAHHHHPF